MVKYLQNINTKYYFNKNSFLKIKITIRDLSGTDLFIYIFDEKDDDQNKHYFECFKNHLKILNDNKISMGFNLLFLSVNEIVKDLNREKPKKFFGSFINNSNIKSKTTFEQSKNIETN